MNGKDIFLGLKYIDPDLVEEAEFGSFPKARTLRRPLLVAAVIALTLLLVGCAVSFIVSVVVIQGLMEYVRKRSFAAFGAYRIVLGAVVLMYFLIKSMIG